MSEVIGSLSNSEQENNSNPRTNNGIDLDELAKKILDLLLHELEQEKDRTGR